MKIRRRSIAVFLVFFLVFFFSASSLAGYTIVPMQFNLNAKPGETVTHTMEAENTGEKPVSIKVVTQDFIKGPYGEEKQVKAGTVSWIRP